MSEVHPGHLLTSEYVRVLTEAGLAVGDGIQPDGVGWNAAQDEFAPYAVVHSIVAAGATDGSIGAPDGDLWPRHNVISYGGDRYQCEHVATRVRTAIAAAEFVVAGRKVSRRYLEMAGGAERDDTQQPPLWWCGDRFRAFSTPA